MEKILLICIVVLLIAFLYRPYGMLEGFNGWSLASSTHLENAHGSAPAGVNASPGRPQYEQDSNNPHVNPMYKTGNPQNIQDAYKKQPGFAY